MQRQRAYLRRAATAAADCLKEDAAWRTEVSRRGRTRPYPVLSTADKLGQNELGNRTAGCPAGANIALPGSAPGLAWSTPKGGITRLPGSWSLPSSSGVESEAVFALLDSHQRNPRSACEGHSRGQALLGVSGGGGGQQLRLFVALLGVAAELSLALLLLAPSEFNELEGRALR